jgi:RNA polymerase sigma factor (sigma-70 family)
LEGAPVFNPTYIVQECEDCFVAENSPAENSSKVKPSDWLEDEIADIRKTLWKSAVLRINLDDVEDLVQDTLLTMVAKPPADDLAKGLLVWSLGILRNKVGNYYRKCNRYQSLDRLGKAEQPQQRPASSPESTLSDTELRTIIREKISEMPPGLRKVMEMLAAGLDSNEIVAELQPERYQNIINRLHRGRKKLAKELLRYGYGQGALTKMKRAGTRNTWSGRKSPK